MSKESAASRVVAPILVTAITTSAVAAALNLATDWKNNLWAWLAVGVLTLTSGGVAVWLYRKQTAAADELSRRAPVENEAEIGRRSRVGRVLLAAKQRNSLCTGSHTSIKDLTMQAGTTNDSDRTATRMTSAANMQSNNSTKRSSKSSRR